jgi:isoleucyl-tRNA synthetase
MSPLQERGIVRAILDISMRDDIYGGVKTVMWSVVEETALAEAEVECKEIESPAINVVFRILHSSNPALLETSCVIWTTTPWTLPANRATAYCLETAYVVLEVLFVTDDSTARKDRVF